MRRQVRLNRKVIMKNQIKMLILSSFFAFNLRGAAPAPVQPALILLPDEIAGLESPNWGAQYEAIQQITHRGVDLATLDAYLAQDRRFEEVYNRTFKTFTSAIDKLDLQLFEYVLAHHPDAINKKYFAPLRSPLNEALEKENYLFGDKVKLAVLQTMIKLLVNHGADKESPYLSRNPDHDYLATPLVQAIEAADYDIVAFLVAEGANVNAKDSKGNTTLKIARYWRNSNPPVYDKIIEVQGTAEKQPVSWDQFEELKNLALSGSHQLFDYW